MDHIKDLLQFLDNSPVNFLATTVSEPQTQVSTFTVSVSMFSVSSSTVLEFSSKSSYNFLNAAVSNLKYLFLGIP